METKENFTTRRKRTPPSNIDVMMYGKVPPQAKELEEAVLGAIMLEKNAFDQIIGILKSDCFYSDANKLIFKAFEMLHFRNMPIDLLTVVEQLKQNEELELVGGPYYVSKLTNHVVSAVNIEVHSRIVLQKYMQREMIRINGELINMAYDDSTDVFDLLDSADSQLIKLRMGNTGAGYKSFQKIAIETIKDIEEARRQDKSITGVVTGFKDLDMVTCGWQKSDLIILAARPSVGKTAFALTLAKNAATDKENPVSVGFFSLEMKDRQLVKRVLSQQSGVWLHRFKNGRMDNQQMQDVINAASDLKYCKIFIDETAALSIGDFKSKARMMKLKENVGLIIVDYLQLMRFPGERKREREISEISQTLKNTAKELDIPIIALSQLSRELEKGGGKVKREPQLSDLRESGAIEQDADMVMFLYKPSDAEVAEDFNLKDVINAKIAKHRNGDLANFIGKFKGETQTHEYLNVVDGNTFKPLGNNWKPVSSLPPSAIDYSQPTKNDETDDMPF